MTDTPEDVADLIERFSGDWYRLTDAKTRREFAELHITRLAQERDVMQGDFNDCNSERARWRRVAERCETEKQAAEQALAAVTQELADERAAYLIVKPHLVARAEKAEQELAAREKEAAAAWDKCEERRLEGVKYRDALKPFAKTNERLERDYSEYPDKSHLFFGVTHGDFRKAAAALKEHTDNG